MKKADFIIIAVVCVLAAAIFTVITFFQEKSTQHDEKAIYVTCNGECIGIYSLTQDTEIPLETEYGYNLLIIKNRTASITEADCNNHQCIEQGSISEFGESIICLPHRLVITIVGEQQPEYDTIVH